MKTVAITLQFKSKSYSDWQFVTENAVFGKGLPYKSANQLINEVKEMHKNYSYCYIINSITIG
jgi:hypothetical protein